MAGSSSTSAPRAVFFRITDDPAPRLLYFFDPRRAGRDAPRSWPGSRPVTCPAEELIVGGAFSQIVDGPRAWQPWVRRWCRVSATLPGSPRLRSTSLKEG